MTYKLAITGVVVIRQIAYNSTVRQSESTPNSVRSNSIAVLRVEADQ